MERSSCCNEHLDRRGEKDAFLLHAGSRGGRLHFKFSALH